MPVSVTGLNIDNERPIFVVLLHSPMVDRIGKEVTTAVTNLDIHDIARSCKTYGVKRYFIVNPEPEQERMVKTILDHWKQEVSKVHHPSRAQALELVRFVRTFEEAFNEASLESAQCGESEDDKSVDQRPYVVMPDARDLTKYFSEIWSYEELRRRIEQSEIPGDLSTSMKRPVMIVFGTGWGIAPVFFEKVDQVLAPLRTKGNRYNHLSVRAAAAIVLDRLFGEK